MNTDITNAAKAAGWTSLFTFVALFGVTLLGWLQDVTVWASDSGVAEFPTLSVLGYGVIAAAAAAATGFVNFVVRFAQAKGVLPGSGPDYGVIDTTGFEKG